MSGAELQGESRVRENFMHGLVGGVKPCRARSAMRGFTLTELLTVISIIAVLFAMLSAALRQVRDRGKQVICMNNLRQIGLGLMSYANEHDGYIPPIYTTPANTYWTHSLVNNGYFTTNGAQKLFVCPSASSANWLFQTYGMNCGASATPAINFSIQLYSPSVNGWPEGTSPSGFPLLADSGRWTSVSSGDQSYYFYSKNPSAGTKIIRLGHFSNANILFCDGHVEPCNQERIAALGITSPAYAP
ncbi:MAG: type II secretion system protein [Verrucomicrobiae bacterium]|nr:type II secretion system protein [Verrucomicrobiae bacterium]